MEKKLIFSKIGLLILAVVISCFIVLKYIGYRRESILLISISSLVLFFIFDGLTNRKIGKKRKRNFEFIEKPLSIKNSDVIEKFQSASYTVGQKIEFNYTGNLQTFPVNNAKKVRVWVRGGDGNKYGPNYGQGQSESSSFGGWFCCEYTIQGETNIYVVVGRQADNNGGGWPNGGDGGNVGPGMSSGGGGGSSDIRRSNADIYSLEGIKSIIAIAGGGGGRGFGEEQEGGNALSINGRGVWATYWDNTEGVSTGQQV